MQPTTRRITIADTGKALQQLVTVFGPPATVRDGTAAPTEIQALYHAALSRLTPGQLRAATAAAIAELEFFPRPAELRRLAPETEHRVPEIAEPPPGVWDQCDRRLQDLVNQFGRDAK